MTSLDPAATPRNVVITGTSTGIGRACALYLDGLGDRVFAGVRRRADGEALRTEASDRLTPILLDVTDETAIAAAAETVADAVGAAGLQGLVNNAGVVVAAPLEFMPLAAFRRQFEVNVTGQIAVTQAFLSLLRAGRGRVVNIGSTGGEVSKPFVGAYCASKFALEALTDALRMELRPWGIQVSIIDPGAVATPIWEKSKAATEALIDGLPPRAHDLYGPAFDAAREVMSSRDSAGLSPERIARVVGRALTAKRPRTRYRVGRHARMQALAAALLPDRLLDWLILREMRLLKRAFPRTPGADSRRTGDVNL